MTKDYEILIKKFEEQEKRIKELEGKINENKNHYSDKNVESTFEIEKTISSKKLNKNSEFPSLSFNQVITSLGVIGIVIGLISFFFYAVINNWISQLGQVMIGIIIGIGLFALSYKLFSKNPNWSNIVYGGSLFIFYLSLGFGVTIYKVFDISIGILLAIIFVSLSLFMTYKFKTRAIAYFSIFGGYLVPFILGIGGKDSQYSLFFYLLLSLILAIISYKLNFSDLRLLSYVIPYIYLLLNEFYLGVELSLFYIIALFLLFSISSLIGSLKSKKELLPLDASLLAILLLTSSILISNLLNLDLYGNGMLMLFYTIFYLLALLILMKVFIRKLPETILMTLLSLVFLSLNLSLIFFFTNLEIEFLIVFFITQYALISYIKSKSNIVLFFDFLSYIKLGLIFFWFLYIIRFDQGLLHASIYLFIFILISIIFLLLAKKDINYYTNAGSFIVWNFLVLFSIYKYLFFFINNSQIASVILSIMWLVYTLLIFTQLQTKKGKYLVGFLLIITLGKIAFIDLFFLEDIFRILGFIIFGVLLLLGGYFLQKKEI